MAFRLDFPRLRTDPALELFAEPEMKCLSIGDYLNAEPCDVSIALPLAVQYSSTPLTLILTFDINRPNTDT